MTDASNYDTITAEMYRVKTLVPYTEESELRIYEVSSDDLSGFVVDMNNPEHGEEVVNITAIEDE